MKKDNATIDIENDRRLTIAEACKILGVKRETLANWRSRMRRGIAGDSTPNLPYNKVGKSITYLFSDVKALLDASRIVSTFKKASITKESGKK